MEKDLEKGSQASNVEANVQNLETSTARDPVSEKQPVEAIAAANDNAGHYAPRPSSPGHRSKLSVNLEVDGTPRPRSPVNGRAPSVETQTRDRPRSRSPVSGRGSSLEIPGNDRPRPRSPVYGRGPSIEISTGDAPQPPSPIYGRGPSIEVLPNDGPWPPSPIYGFRPSLEFQGESTSSRNGTPSVYDPGRRRSSDYQQGEVHHASGRLSSDVTAKGNLDFSWILRHHNKELVSTIKLQEPSQPNRFFDAVKSWRPWGTGGSEGAVPAQGTWTRKDKHNSIRISIAELHRMRMRKLQCKLASHAWYMKRFNKEPAGWEDDLQEYTKALQDYDYMTKCSARQRDSFLISGERNVDDYVMRKVVGITDDALGDGHRPIPVAGPWEKHNEPIGGTRNENVKKSWTRNFERRLVMAALGGTFLVGPMWLMVLHNTLYTALVSTTLFVYAFGFLMSMLLERPMDVLSGTAAYAAVLVVFVGLGTSNNTSASSA